MNRHHALVLSVLLVIGGATRTAPVDDDGPQTTDEAADSLASLTADIRKLTDWDVEYVHIARAVDNIWARYGWDDEGDRFARDLTLDVAKIPPWEIMKRLRRANEVVADRYDLSGDQSATLQRAMIRETAGFLMKNAVVLVKHTREMIDTRMAGKPITAEQIAKWTKADGPLWHDAQERIDRAVQEIRATLTPKQRKVFDRDVRSMDRRFETLDHMREQWAKGRWKLEDWGMQNYPIDPLRRPVDDAARRATVKRATPDRVPTLVNVVTRWKTHDPSTWHAYLTHVKTLYEFDPGQADAARSIHTELRDRAVDFLTARSDRMEGIAKAERATHEAYEPVRELFAELQTRLLALLTETQRGLAEQRSGGARKSDASSNDAD